MLTDLLGVSLPAALRIIASINPDVVTSAALLAALTYSVISARRDGLDHRAMYWAGVLGLFFGIWGGHLLGIVYYGTDGRPWAWLRFWSGGQAQYGGLIAGALAATLFFRLRKVPFLTYADAAIPAVALGVAIGRIGCFLNGDDFGTLSHLPWAVRFPLGTEAYADHLTRGWIAPGASWSLPVHPIQLYDTVFWFALFTFFVAWRPRRPGLRFGLFMILHGAGRITEQFFRGDFQSVLGPLSLTQLISVFLVAAGFAVLLFLPGSRHAEVSTGVVSKPGRSRQWQPL